MRFLLTLDRDLLEWLRANRSGTLDAVMKAVTHAGDRPVVTVIAVVAVLALFLRKRRREAVAVAVAGLLSLALTEGVKALVARERPQVKEPVVERPESYSFPSGHALSSAAVYGVLALLAARRVRPAGRKALIVGGALVLVALIGFSRLYLQVHHGSDVVAGFAAGWGLALLCDWWVGLEAQPSPSGPV
jgi:undecaprenyl-diphosphatase